MKCEIEWCEEERSCLYYCREHHKTVCVEGNTYIPAIKPNKSLNSKDFFRTWIETIYERLRF